MGDGNNLIGVGASKELDLRVSVGTLIGVVFDSPEDGRRMLALERTATLRDTQGRSGIDVWTKPFGGAVRLLDPPMLKVRIGDFHYDSEQSRQEGDFRIQINRSSWSTIKDICTEALKGVEKPILDFSPHRELAEEFEASVGMVTTPSQYTLRRRDLIVEDIPYETNSVRAQGVLTVRVYYIFEARIHFREIVELMLASSRRYSDRDLHNMARQDSRRGGKGRASGIVALGLDEVKDAYRSIPFDRRSEPVRIGEHHLDGNVAAVLDDIDHPRYHRYAI